MVTTTVGGAAESSSSSSLSQPVQNKTPLANIASIQNHAFMFVLLVRRPAAVRFRREPSATVGSLAGRRRKMKRK
jgi:hypothetical protein